MQIERNKQQKAGTSPQLPDSGERYGWKEQTYVVPSPSRTGFQWKASALYGLQRLDRRSPRQNVTVVVPALYSRMPAEVLALGWLNDIDSLARIRHRIVTVAKQIGWDVFTFHTRHNLDAFYDSTIRAVRETWLNEGALNSAVIAQTRKRFGAAYDYHRIEPRLVENLLIQSSLMNWLSVHAGQKPLQFQVIGTGLLSALVWSGSLTFECAVRTAVNVGVRWDANLLKLAEEDIRRSGASPSEENLGWQRFHRVRQIIEGKESLSLAVDPADLPQVEGPSRPFLFAATSKDEPVRIQTREDVRQALEAMNLASWTSDVPALLAQERRGRGVRGWLASPMHPVASACHWSVYNYLLATPAASQLFLDHIAPNGAVAPLTHAPKVLESPVAATYPPAVPLETRSEPGH